MSIKGVEEIVDKTRVGLLVVVVVCDEWCCCCLRMESLNVVLWVAALNTTWLIAVPTGRNNHSISWCGSSMIFDIMGDEYSMVLSFCFIIMVCYVIGNMRKTTVLKIVQVIGVLK